MAFVFPPNPAVGDQYVGPNGATYAWDGASWVVTGSAVVLPPNADGYLKNDGAGTLSWDTPSGGGGTPLPADAAGLLTNDGSGGLSWKWPVDGRMTHSVGSTTTNVFLDNPGSIGNLPSSALFFRCGGSNRASVAWSAFSSSEQWLDLVSSGSVPIRLRLKSTTPIANNEASIEGLPATTVGADSIITRGRGDARYLQLAGGATTGAITNGTYAADASSTGVTLLSTGINSSRQGASRVVTNSTSGIGLHMTVHALNVKGLVIAAAGLSQGHDVPLLEIVDGFGQDFRVGPAPFPDANDYMWLTLGDVTTNARDGGRIFFARQGINALGMPNNGGLQVTGFDIATGTGAAWATINSASGWTAGSDERLKEDIRQLDYGLDEVLAMAPIRYKWAADGREDIGFGAQTMQLLVPEVVDHIESDDPAEEFWGLRKDGIVPILVRAIQQLAARLDALEAA